MQEMQKKIFEQCGSGASGPQKIAISKKKMNLNDKLVQGEFPSTFYTSMVSLSPIRHCNDTSGVVYNFILLNIFSATKLAEISASGIYVE